MSPTWRSLIKSCLPGFIVERWERRVRRRSRRQKIEAITGRDATSLTVDDINHILDQLDIGHTDLLLHSSTSRAGRIVGGPRCVQEAILSRLNLETQTLMVPTFPWDGMMQEYVTRPGLTFDAASTPNRMGMVACLFQRMDGARRSLHPTHPVSAIGCRADEYVKGHERSQTPFDRHSPYFKLLCHNGKILMFGVDLNSVSNLHVYEDLLFPDLPFPVYLDAEYSVPCTNISGEICNVTTRCLNAAFSSTRDCERARPGLIRNHWIRTIPFGRSEISLLDARGYTINHLQMLLAGESVYGPVELSPDIRQRVQELLGEINHPAQ